jgi:hypothetical protein
LRMLKLKLKDFERELRRAEGQQYSSSNLTTMASTVRPIALPSKPVKGTSARLNEGLRNWKIILRLFEN